MESRLRMHLSNRQRKVGHIWFDINTQHEHVLLMIGLDKLTEAHVENIMQRMKFQQIPGVLDVSSCGYVLTFEADYTSELFAKTPGNPLKELIVEQLRPSLIVAMQAICPDRLRQVANKSHKDKYAHLAPAAQLA